MSRVNQPLGFLVALVGVVGAIFITSLFVRGETIEEPAATADIGGDQATIIETREKRQMPAWLFITICAATTAAVWLLTTVALGYSHYLIESYRVVRPRFRIVQGRARQPHVGADVRVRFRAARMIQSAHEAELLPECT